MTPASPGHIHMWIGRHVRRGMGERDGVTGTGWVPVSWRATATRCLGTGARAAPTGRGHLSRRPPQSRRRRAQGAGAQNSDHSLEAIGRRRVLLAIEELTCAFELPFRDWRNARRGRLSLERRGDSDENGPGTIPIVRRSATLLQSVVDRPPWTGETCASSPCKRGRDADVSIGRRSLMRTLARYERSDRLRRNWPRSTNVRPMWRHARATWRRPFWLCQMCEVHRETDRPRGRRSCRRVLKRRSRGGVVCHGAHRSWESSRAWPACADGAFSDHP